MSTISLILLYCKNSAIPTQIGVLTDWQIWSKHLPCPQLSTLFLRGSDRICRKNTTRAYNRPTCVSCRSQGNSRRPMGKQHPQQAEWFGICSRLFQLVYQRVRAQRSIVAGICVYLLEGNIESQAGHLQPVWGLKILGFQHAEKMAPHHQCFFLPYFVFPSECNRSKAEYYRRAETWLDNADDDGVDSQLEVSLEK